MSLFTDNDVINVSDLNAIDSQAAVAAATENPPISIPTIINNTVSEAGEELLSRFQTYSGYLVSPSMPINHVAAVMNIFSTSVSRPRFRLNQVVALSPDPSVRLLKRWFIYSSLYEIYRAAFARYLKANDRYQRKLDWYNMERQEAWSRLQSTGIPIVLVPLPCPGAVREPGAGTFGSSNVSVGGTGSTDPGSTWYVVATWTGAAYVSPTAPAQNESAPSAAVQAITTIGQLITVNINGLNPPTINPPNVGTANGLYTQMAATGWLIYIGSSVSGPFYLQNSSPLPLGTKSYTLPDAPVQSGAFAGVGQAEEYNYAWMNVRMRG